MRPSVHLTWSKACGASRGQEKIDSGPHSINTRCTVCSTVLYAHVYPSLYAIGSTTVLNCAPGSYVRCCTGVHCPCVPPFCLLPRSTTSSTGTNKPYTCSSSSVTVCVCLHGERRVVIVCSGSELECVFHSVMFGPQPHPCHRSPGHTFGRLDWFFLPDEWSSHRGYR